MITPVILIESEQITNAQRLITETMELVCPLNCHPPIIFCHSKYQVLVTKIVKQLNISALVLCAPCERGSTIALTCAAQMSLLNQQHATLAIFHHWQPITDLDGFEHSLCLGAQLARENYLVTIDNPLNCQFFAQSVAVNSWMINAELLLDTMQQQHPDVLENCQKAIESDEHSIHSTLRTLKPTFFSACPVMENETALFPFITQRVDIPLCTRWSIVVPEKPFKLAIPSFCFTNKR